MKRIVFPFLFLMFVFMSCQKEVVPEFSEFTDARDGYTYETVQIGSQVWMAENLKYLPEVYDPQHGSETEKCYYVYDYYGTSVEDAKTTGEYETYGVLYNFRAALEDCPGGWHLPNEKEWKELRRTVGYYNGAKLRSISYWPSDKKGDNSSGFNALPAGGVDNGGFEYIGENVGFWSTEETTDVAGRAWVWGFPWNYKTLEKDDAEQLGGTPVRCIKD